MVIPGSTNVPYKKIAAERLWKKTDILIFKSHKNLHFVMG